MTQTSEASLDRDVEIALLEWEVCQAAVAYVQGVGDDSNSIQAESDAMQRFTDQHNALVASTKALIAVRKKAETEVLYPLNNLPDKMFERNPVLQGEE